MTSAASHLGQWIGRFDRHRGGVLASLILALGACTSPLAGAQAAAAPAASAASSSITAITLERNCFGCAAGGSLVLQRDGVATFTSTGSARQGTVDQISRGTVRREDFDALARLAVAQGFFAMNDSYEDPSIRDGAWTTIGIVRGGQNKQVFRREDNGPAALKAIEAAIDAVQGRIRFLP